MIAEGAKATPLLRVAALACAAWLGCGASCAPPPKDPEPAPAKQLCSTALDHLARARAAAERSGDFLDLAVRELEAAYEALPRPGVLLRIALAYDERGDLENARIHARRYADAEPGDAEARAYADELLQRLARQRIAYESSFASPSEPRQSVLEGIASKYEKRCKPSEREICDAVIEQVKLEQTGALEDEKEKTAARDAMRARADASDPYGDCR